MTVFLCRTSRIRETGRIVKLLARRWAPRALSVFLFVAILPISIFDSGVANAADDWMNATSNLANMQSECGNLTLLSAVPHSNSVIAGVARQGLWISNDAGNSWQPLGTSKGSARITNRPSWISYDPVNPARFYESGAYNEGGVFTTGDSGTTFGQLGSVRHNDFVSVDYADSDRKTLLAGGHEQAQTVWKSNDGGKSWSNVASNLPSDGWSGDPLLIDARTYLVNVTGSGIFRTTDGATSWTRVASLSATGAPLVASDGTVYWAAGDALAKSSDRGVTWSLVGAGFVNGLHPIEVPGGRLVTATEDTLVASSDGGATWDSFGPPLPYPPAGMVYSDSQKALFISHWDCGNFVLPDAIQKLNIDFAALSIAPIAQTGLAASGVTPATAAFRANWVSPTYVTAGQSITVHQDTYANQDMNITLSVGIFNGRGEPVLQSSLDNQTLLNQRITSLTTSIPLPASLPAGTYTVKTAAFGPDGTQYARSDSAGKFVAIAAPQTQTLASTEDTLDDSGEPQSAASDAQ